MERQQIHRATALLFQYIRNSTNYKQDELAQKLRLNQSSVSRLQRGLTVPATKTIRRIEIMTGKTLRQLCYEALKEYTSVSGHPDDKHEWPIT